MNKYEDEEMKVVTEKIKCRSMGRCDEKEKLKWRKSRPKGKGALKRSFNMR